MYEDFQLLVDGKNAFKEIIECIRNSKKSIYINMFIFRDDEIGKKIIQELLKKANEGVVIYISVDRFAASLEYAEEYKLSFFHRDKRFIDKLKAKTLNLQYKNLSVKEKTSSKTKSLYNEVMSHQNITVDKDKDKKDHSKYYIFDDEILILGGINIEDKENGQDIIGRIYQDYMVKLKGKEYVQSFLIKLTKNINRSDDYFFGVNIKEPKKIFEMKKMYIEMIDEASEELTIIMPYFQYVKDVCNSIINAYKRGVKVRILAPLKPNFQESTNAYCFKRLLKESNNEIEIYLSDKMVHTKAMISDKLITIGSCNIANKSFNVLSELNLFVKNVDCKFKNDFLLSVNENINASKKINNYNEIKYNKYKAFVENLFV